MEPSDFLIKMFQRELVNEGFNIAGDIGKAITKEFIVW